MGIFDIFRTKQASSPAKNASASNTTTVGDTQWFRNLDDPDLIDFLRAGNKSEAGALVSAKTALTNMAVLRCCSLISQSIGMLPLNLYEFGDEKRKAVDHPLHTIFRETPNTWQTPYEFKTTMQLRALTYGAAYAYVVRSAGRVIRLVPLEPTRVEPVLSDTWEMVYRYTKPTGGTIDLKPNDVLVINDMSLDAENPLPRVKMAREAIGLAMQAERAAARLFRNGVMAGGAFTHPGSLTDEAFVRLQQSILERHAGPENAHKWMILEEGMKAEQFAQTASDSQHIENRNHQIEEIARAFGIPRPLLMMDDTSWGSGIEQLGIFFVQYTLQPWMTAWEEGINRTLLTPEERKRYYAKYNERALLRGTLKDQADFFTKALGSGGHSPWMTVNEVRDLSELSESSDPNADSLTSPLMQRNSNEPTQTAAD